MPHERAVGDRALICPVCVYIQGNTGPGRGFCYGSDRNPHTEAEMIGFVRESAVNSDSQSLAGELAEAGHAVYHAYAVYVIQGTLDALREAIDEMSETLARYHEAVGEPVHNG